MGINFLDYSKRVNPEYDLELEESNISKSGVATNPVKDGNKQLMNSLEGLASIASVNVLNKRGCYTKPATFVFKTNPYASLPEYKAKQVLAEKLERQNAPKPVETDFSREIEETEAGRMTRHAVSIEKARKYYDEHRFDVDSEFLNADGTFRGVLLNTETGDIALDLPQLRDDEIYTPFTINDIVNESTQETGLLSHNTTIENAKSIRENGFDQKLCGANKGSADGIYFYQGHSYLPEHETVNAFYDGKMCEADLERLEGLAKKLQYVHGDEFDGTENLARVFLQSLLSEIGYDGIVSENNYGKKEVVAFDPSKITVA